MHVVVQIAHILGLGMALGVLVGAVRGFPAEVASVAEQTGVCADPVPAAPSVHWVTLDDASRLLAERGTVFVDARERATFERGHITGALSAPIDVGTLSEDVLALVRPYRTVVAYCDTAGGCASSSRLAMLLASSGIPDVRVLEGGFPAWLERGLPAEAGPCRACP